MSHNATEPATLDELAYQVLTEKQNQNEQIRSVRLQSMGLWRALSAEVEGIVDRASESILTLTGGLHFERVDNGFGVRRQAMPEIHVDVQYYETSIGVQWETVHPSLNSQKRYQTLSIMTDRDARVYLADENGRALPVNKAALYLLKPLVST